MLNHKELKEKLKEIIKTYNDKGEDEAIKLLEEIIQEEKGKVADLGFKTTMAALDAVSKNQQK